MGEVNPESDHILRPHFLFYAFCTLYCIKKYIFKAFAVSENLGRLLESQVFIELVRRGYDTEKAMFYYRSRNDKEVDFALLMMLLAAHDGVGTVLLRAYFHLSKVKKRRKICFSKVKYVILPQIYKRRNDG